MRGGRHGQGDVAAGHIFRRVQPGLRFHVVPRRKARHRATGPASRLADREAGVDPAWRRIHRDRGGAALAAGQPDPDGEVHAAKAKEALDRLVSFRPDLLLVSAGFDAYVNDPLMNLRLEAEHFNRFGTWLREINIPVAAALEGGYSDELPGLVESFIRGWTGEKT